MFLEKSDLMAKFLVFVVFMCVALAGADVIYVDISASGPDSDPNAGISWERAYVDLQNAIGAALSGDDIWVAEGIYKPTDGSDTSANYRSPATTRPYGLRHEKYTDGCVALRSRSVTHATMGPLTKCNAKARVRGHLKQNG